MNGNLYLGLETGGSKITAVVADADYKVLAEAKALRDPGNTASHTLDLVIETIKAAAQRAKVDTSDLTAMGWGFGGTVDREQNEPHVNLHEEGWTGLAARAKLEEIFQRPVFCENDCNVAALGEAHLGAGSTEGVSCYITVGTGIGGGIVKDGSLLACSRYGEGEIGHIAVDLNGPLCPCGNRGCLEACCSGSGLAKVILDMAENYKDTSELASQVAALPPLDVPPLVFSRYPNDPLSSACVAYFSERMGLACSILVNLLVPQTIVLGGGVMRNLWLIDKISESMQAHIPGHLHHQCKIVSSGLGERVVPMGAVVYAALCHNHTIEG